MKNYIAHFVKIYYILILNRNLATKLIGKNIQYMNSYEIFKNAKKLSLTDGKIALFEHIDEYPLFMNMI